MTDFSKTREFFDLPKGVIYLDGNSLGPLPRNAVDRMRHVMEREWGAQLIRAWNQSDWITLPARVGARIGRLIGAPKDSVTTGDTLTIKVYQALAAALPLRPDRRKIVSDNGNFPTDLYMAEGLIRTLGRDHELVIAEPEAVADAIDEETAAVLLTHVDYRTGQMHDMEAVTRRAHAAGALMIWDLAHSAGAVPVDLSGCGADFAVGCTYKYLNGGPGGPAFIYVKPTLQETVEPALSGWMGHAKPFAFDLEYRAAQGIERMRVGTPPILQLSALDAALDIWDEVEIDDLRRRSVELCERFIAGVEAACPQLELASPRNAAERGSQISFRFSKGYAAMQALIDRGVIGDFRVPDIMRFGFAPLYVTPEDVDKAIGILDMVINQRVYQEARYQTRLAVT